jgi:hypothetical protein
MFGRYDGKPLIFWFWVRDSVGFSFPLDQAYHQVECPSRTAVLPSHYMTTMNTNAQNERGSVQIGQC